MNPMRFDNLQTILCIGCHADDIEIGCGGTLLRLLDEHADVTVHWVVLSATAERAAEAQRSAETFTAKAAARHITIKDFRDSYFPWDGDRIKDFMHELAANVSPDLVLTHRHDDMHQDHKIASQLTRNAFRNHAIWEYEIPKYDGDLGANNLYLPLSEDVCRRKIDLIMRMFPSQHGRDWFTPDTFEALLRLRGVECHSPTRFAEAMFTRKIVI
jgi:LmbE family N-acetylglucosaminyl deacetylase